MTRSGLALLLVILAAWQPALAASSVARTKVLFEQANTPIQLRAWVAQGKLHVLANANKFDIEGIALVRPDGEKVTAEFSRVSVKSQASIGFGFGFGTWRHSGRSSIGAGVGVGTGVPVGRAKTQMHAVFALPPWDSGLWHVSIKLFDRPAAVVPLGRVKPIKPEKTPSDACHQIFGYHKEIWTAPDGSSAATMARTRDDGWRVAALSRDGATRLLPVLDELCNKLPASIMAMQRTPVVAQSLSQLLENGVRYRGPATANGHYVEGSSFWLAPQQTGGKEDVPDTLLFLLFEANNAARASDWQRLRKDSGKLSETEFIQRAAALHGDSLAATLRLLKQYQRRLKLKKRIKQGQGQHYRKTLAWYKQAGKDSKKMARIMLDDNGPSLVLLNYGSGPYRERLQQLYQQFRTGSS